MAKPTRRRRLLRWAGCSALALVLLVAGVVGVLYALSRQTPDFYAQWEQQTDAEKRQAEASLQAKLEAFLANASAQVNDPTATGVNVYGQPISLKMRDPSNPERVNPLMANIPMDIVSEIDLTNAELAALTQQQLDLWLAQRNITKPENVENPIAAVVEGKLFIGCHYTHSGFDQVVWGEIKLDIEPNGVGRTRLQNLNVGNLPVPIDSIGSTLASRADGDDRDNVRRFGEKLEELRDFEFRPVLELEQRRRARIEQVTILEAGVRIRLRLQDHQTYREHNEQLASVPML